MIFLGNYLNDSIIHGELRNSEETIETRTIGQKEQGVCRSVIVHGMPSSWAIHQLMVFISFSKCPREHRGDIVDPFEKEPLLLVVNW